MAHWSNWSNWSNGQSSPTGQMSNWSKPETGQKSKWPNRLNAFLGTGRIFVEWHTGQTGQTGQLVKLVKCPSGQIVILVKIRNWSNAKVVKFT
jgi:hypothetical protein